jgi:signal recognition particle receptor subunit beta
MGQDAVSFKLVVTGPFGAGKTTLIQAISQTPVVATEVPTGTGPHLLGPGEDGSGSRAGGGAKTSTTVSMDFGTRVVEGGATEPPVELLLFGTPGQERFSFMWEILARGMDGLLMIVDASDPLTWGDAATMLRTFRRMHRGTLVVAANRASAREGSVARLGRQLDLHPDVPIVACDVIDPASARQAVLVLLEEILVHAGG